MEPPGKILWFSLQLNLIFSIYKISNIVYARFLKIVLSSRIRQFKKIILEERGFRGGSDEKMRRMWLGLEIFVTGPPPLL